MVLAVVAVVRHLANAYLAALVGPRLGAESGARYLQASVWLLVVYLCTAGCARAVRSTAVLLRHERFRAAPVPRRTFLVVIAHATLFRPTSVALVGLLSVSLAASVAVWGPGSVAVAGLCWLLGAGTAAFVAAYAALVLWGMSDRALGYLELLALFALVYANPDVRVVDGRISLALVNGAVAAPAGTVAACLSVAAIPAVLAAAATAAAGVRALVARRRSREYEGRRAARAPLTRLYRADLPLAVFAVASLAEAVLVVGGTQPIAALRGLSAALLALRLGWYALFLVRTEYRMADWRPAPVLGPRERLLAYARTAPAHAAICVAPLLFYVVRALRA